MDTDESEPSSPGRQGRTSHPRVGRSNPLFTSSSGSSDAEDNLPGPIQFPPELLEHYYVRDPECESSTVMELPITDTERVPVVVVPSPARNQDMDFGAASPSVGSRGQNQNIRASPASTPTSSRTGPLPPPPSYASSSCYQLGCFQFCSDVPPSRRRTTSPRPYATPLSPIPVPRHPAASVPLKCYKPSCNVHDAGFPVVGLAVQSPTPPACNDRAIGGPFPVLRTAATENIISSFRRRARSDGSGVASSLVNVQRNAQPLGRVFVLNPHDADGYESGAGAGVAGTTEQGLNMAAYPQSPPLRLGPEPRRRLSDLHAPRPRLAERDGTADASRMSSDHDASIDEGTDVGCRSSGSLGLRVSSRTGIYDIMTIVRQDGSMDTVVHTRGGADIGHRGVRTIGSRSPRSLSKGVVNSPTDGSPRNRSCWESACGCDKSVALPSSPLRTVQAGSNGGDVGFGRSSLVSELAASGGIPVGSIGSPTGTSMAANAGAADDDRHQRTPLARNEDAHPLLAGQPLLQAEEEQQPQEGPLTAIAPTYSLVANPLFRSYGGVCESFGDGDAEAPSKLPGSDIASSTVGKDAAATDAAAETHALFNSNTHRPMLRIGGVRASSSGGGSRDCFTTAPVPVLLGVAPVDSRASFVPASSEQGDWEPDLFSLPLPSAASFEAMHATLSTDGNSSRCSSRQLSPNRVLSGADSGVCIGLAGGGDSGGGGRSSFVLSPTRSSPSADGLRVLDLTSLQEHLQHDEKELTVCGALSPVSEVSPLVGSPDQSGSHDRRRAHSQQPAVMELATDLQLHGADLMAQARQVQLKGEEMIAAAAEIQRRSIEMLAAANETHEQSRILMAEGISTRLQGAGMLTEARKVQLQGADVMAAVARGLEEMLEVEVGAEATSHTRAVSRHLDAAFAAPSAPSPRVPLAVAYVSLQDETASAAVMGSGDGHSKRAGTGLSALGSAEHFKGFGMQASEGPSTIIDAPESASSAASEDMGERQEFVWHGWEALEKTAAVMQTEADDLEEGEKQWGHHHLGAYEENRFEQDALQAELVIKSDSPLNAQAGVSGVEAHSLSQPSLDLAKAAFGSLDVTVVMVAAPVEMATAEVEDTSVATPNAAAAQTPAAADAKGVVLTEVADETTFLVTTEGGTDAATLSANHMALRPTENVPHAAAAEVQVAEAEVPVKTESISAAVLPVPQADAQMEPLGSSAVILQAFEAAAQTEIAGTSMGEASHPVAEMEAVSTPAGKEPASTVDGTMATGGGVEGLHESPGVLAEQRLSAPAVEVFAGPVGDTLEIPSGVNGEEELAARMDLALRNSAEAMGMRAADALRAGRAEDAALQRLAIDGAAVGTTDQATDQKHRPPSASAGDEGAGPVAPVSPQRNSNAPQLMCVGPDGLTLAVESGQVQRQRRQQTPWVPRTRGRQSVHSQQQLQDSGATSTDESEVEQIQSPRCTAIPSAAATTIALGTVYLGLPTPRRYAEVAAANAIGFSCTSSAVAHGLTEAAEAATASEPLTPAGAQRGHADATTPVVARTADERSTSPSAIGQPSAGGDVWPIGSPSGCASAASRIRVGSGAEALTAAAATSTTSDTPELVSSPRSQAAWSLVTRARGRRKRVVPASCKPPAVLHEGGIARRNQAVESVAEVYSSNLLGSNATGASNSPIESQCRLHPSEQPRSSPSPVRPSRGAARQGHATPQHPSSGPVSLTGVSGDGKGSSTSGALGVSEPMASQGAVSGGCPSDGAANIESFPVAVAEPDSASSSDDDDESTGRGGSWLTFGAGLLASAVLVCASTLHLSANNPGPARSGADQLAVPGHSLFSMDSLENLPNGSTWPDPWNSRSTIGTTHVGARREVPVLAPPTPGSGVKAMTSATEPEAVGPASLRAANGSESAAVDGSGGGFGAPALDDEVQQAELEGGAAVAAALQAHPQYVGSAVPGWLYDDPRVVSAWVEAEISGGVVPRSRLWWERLWHERSESQTELPEDVRPCELQPDEEVGTPDVSPRAVLPLDEVFRTADGATGAVLAPSAEEGGVTRGAVLQLLEDVFEAVDAAQSSETTVHSRMEAGEALSAAAADGRMMPSLASDSLPISSLDDIGPALSAATATAPPAATATQAGRRSMAAYLRWAGICLSATVAAAASALLWAGRRRRLQTRSSLMLQWKSVWDVGPIASVRRNLHDPDEGADLAGPGPSGAPADGGYDAYRYGYAEDASAPSWPLGIPGGVGVAHPTEYDGAYFTRYQELLKQQSSSPRRHLRDVEPDAGLFDCYFLRSNRLVPRGSPRSPRQGGGFSGGGGGEATSGHADEAARRQGWGYRWLRTRTVFSFEQQEVSPEVRRLMADRQQ